MYVTLDSLKNSRKQYFLDHTLYRIHSRKIVCMVKAHPCFDNSTLYNVGWPPVCLAATWFTLERFLVVTSYVKLDSPENNYKG